MRFSSFLGRHFLWHSQKKDVSFLLVSFGEDKKKIGGKFSAELRKSNSIVKSQLFFFFFISSSFSFQAFQHEKFILLSSFFFSFFGVEIIHVHNKSMIISFILT